MERQHIVPDAEWEPKYCPHCGRLHTLFLCDTGGFICEDCDGVFDIDYFPPMDDVTSAFHSNKMDNSGGDK